MPFNHDPFLYRGLPTIFKNDYVAPEDGRARRRRLRAENRQARKTAAQSGYGR